MQQVTLIAVSSVNLAATVAALENCMAKIAFGAAKLLSDEAPARLRDNLEWVPIARLTSARAYSEFVLRQLADHVRTSHCLLVQWDGHVIDASRWRTEFLAYDYVGASWPQFDDGQEVGNGGFSLRSRELLEYCRHPEFVHSHPEDLAICRHNRAHLERRGLNFAPREIADLFSAERAGDPSASFGYHGVWHMPGVLGHERFWEIYRQLDDRTTVRHDFRSLFWQLIRHKGGLRRAVSFALDRAYDRFVLRT